MQMHNNEYRVRIITAIISYIVCFTLVTLIFAMAAGPSNGNAAANVTAVAKEFPFDGPVFLGKPIRILSAETGSEKSYSGYGYIPVVRMEMDWSTLSENEKYWFLKEGSFTAGCWISDTSNGIQPMQLKKRSRKAGKDTIVFEWHADEEDEWMRPFDNASVLISASFLTKSEWVENKDDNGSYEVEKQTYLIEIDKSENENDKENSNIRDIISAGGGRLTKLTAMSM